MAKMTVYVRALYKNPTAPTVDDNVLTVNKVSVPLTTALFTKNFADADGDNYGNITIQTLPAVLKLTILGEDVTPGLSIDADNASALKFSMDDRYAIYSGIMYEFERGLDTMINDYGNQGYRLISNLDGILIFEHEDDATDQLIFEGAIVPVEDRQFTFTISDDSADEAQSDPATITLTPTGDVNIKPVYVNNPPVVGDNLLQTEYDTTLALTQSAFIDDTDPKYSDPEGDQPYQLKVLSLPTNGVLQLNGVDVVVDQILNFGTDITTDPNTTKFKYVPDNTRTDINEVVFRFAVSDTGSKTFVE